MYNRKAAALFIAFSTLLFNLLYGQNQNDKAEFHFYVPFAMYNEQTKRKINESGKFKDYKYLANYYIDRQRKDTVNYKYVDEGLANLFPSKLDSGFLCLNLENKYYKDVRNYDPPHPLFNKGIEELTKLIKYVKLQRPNVKVGIYGIPFNFYWASQMRINEGNKLDTLLNEVDYISPSLYIHYPDKQRGKENNFKYIKDNLKIALGYGSRLNKPVIPYVWYIIHPANKKHGRELISPEEMADYISLIQDFEYNDLRSSGIIWWEPSGTNYRIPSEYNDIKKNMNKLDVLLRYFGQYFND